jgi:ATP-dependent Clp protease ATP-binding subunit ClpX
MNKKTLVHTCNFCDRPATKDVLGELEIFEQRIAKIYLCDQCFKSYKTGNKFGQLQIHQNIMSLIINSEDEAPVISLKEKLAEVAPLSKKFLFEKRLSTFKKVAPQDLYENLNQKVVGQENAKKRISIAVFEHMRNIVHHKLNDKQNILFLGPSGSGKTLIVNTISKYLDVPYVSGDATSFSPTGFQGSDADSCITDLLVKANGEPGLAEKGVVFIDEIDKLASNMSAATRLESFHYSTQSTLLKLIEGKKVKVNSSALGEQGTPPVVVDTSSILFCFGGAFNGLEKIVAKKLGLTEGTIGFRNTKTADYDSQIKNYEIYNQASHEILAESLIEYGMSTEFVGRIQSIVPLVPLSKEQMLYCLLELEDSPIIKNQIMFAESNVKLEFDENYYDEVVEKAIKSGTGTRALNSIVKASISGAAFEVLGMNHPNPKKVFISKECVSNPNAFVVE